MAKKVGRPAGIIQTHQLQTRVSTEFLMKLDEWRRAQPDLPSRTEAIRRIVESVILEPKQAPKQRGKGQ
jgi:hypothetical protein